MQCPKLSGGSARPGAAAGVSGVALNCRGGTRVLPVIESVSDLSELGTSVAVHPPTLHLVPEKLSVGSARPGAAAGVSGITIERHRGGPGGRR